MSDNLLELLNGAVGKTLVGQASTFLGESESATQSAVRTVLPALLAGLAEQAATPEGASALINRVKSSAVDSDLLGNLATLLGSPGSSEALLANGDRLARSVFGDRIDSVTDAIASTSGMQPSAVGKLLAIAAPVVFGFLKNYVAQKWLDADGLARLLTSQCEFLRGSLDDRITGAMGLGGVGSFLAGLASKAAGMVTAAGTEVAAAARSAGDAAARAAETVAGAAAQAVGDVAGKATELAKDTGSAVAGTVKQTGATVTGVAKEAGAAAAGVARAATDTAGEVAEKATGAAKAAGSEALSAAKNVGTTVEEVATTTARVAEKAGKGAYEALEKAVESEAPGMKKYVPWIAAAIVILLLLLIFN